MSCILTHWTTLQDQAHLIMYTSKVHHIIPPQKFAHLPVNGRSVCLNYEVIFKVVNKCGVTYWSPNFMEFLIFCEYERLTTNCMTDKIIWSGEETCITKLRCFTLLQVQRDQHCVGQGLLGQHCCQPSDNFYELLIIFCCRSCQTSIA